MEHPPAADRTSSRPIGGRRGPLVTLVGALALVGVVALVAGCGSSGRDLPVPEPGAVSPTRSSEAVNQTGPFTLSSSAFADGGAIPAEFSCQGPSPELSWSGARPASTSELALVMRDTSLDGFVHWFVAGIGAGESESPQGATPPNVAQLPNSAGAAGYLGPCPPPGETHTYQFELLALSSPAALAVTTPGKDAYAQIQSKVVGRAVLTGTFTRPADGASTTTLDPAATTTSAP